MALRLAMAVAALALAAGTNSPAAAAGVNAQAKAKVVKPLILTSVQDFDLGTLALGTGTWSATVRLSRTGVLTCPATIVCSGATRTAIYNVSGTNKATVTVSTPDVTLVNQSDSSKTLTLVIDSPGTVLVTNSGPPGTNFPLGGSIALTSATASGNYVGTFNVSVEYQ